MNLLTTDYYKLEFENLRTDINADCALAYYMSYLGRHEQDYINWWAGVLIGAQIRQVNEYGRNRNGAGLV